MQTERELMKQEKAHLETERILANKERERHKRAELDLMRKHQMKIREIEAAHEEDLRKMRMMLDDYKEKKLQDQGLVNQLQARNREMSVQLNDARKRAQTLPAKNDAAGDIDPDEYALKKIVFVSGCGRPIWISDPKEAQIRSQIKNLPFGVHSTDAYEAS